MEESFWRQARADGPTARRFPADRDARLGCLLLAEWVARLVLVMVLPVGVMVGISSVLRIVLVLAIVDFTGWYANAPGSASGPIWTRSRSPNSADDAGSGLGL